MTDEGWIRQVRIRWTDAHHPDDDERLIDSALEAAADDGPLLVVSAQARRGPHRQAVFRVLESVLWYKAHLAEHGSDLPGERWVGIAHASGGGTSVDATLVGMQSLLAPLSRSTRVGASAGDLRHGTMASQVPLAESVLVRNEGDVFKDVQRVHPVLRGLMILMPSGIIEYGDDVK